MILFDTSFQGRFEILSLSGSFVLTEAGGNQTRTGGLTVSLAGADGSVVGGVVGGLLIAASPVQVIFK
jgi:predicted DNA-binding protein with PD1-like motif